MGNSRFRLSHIMPNMWFYKLRDISRFRESQRRRLAQRSNSTRDETAVSFPRSSHHFGRSERVYSHRPMHKAQTMDIESMKRKTSKGKKSKSGSSSTVRDSRISAGCSCRATVDSVWKSAETKDDFSSSDEEEEAVSYHSKQANKNCSTQFMARLDRAQLVPELESKSGNWKQPNHHFNDTAGLPSSVNENEDFGHVQPLAHKVKEMLELGQDPFVVDISLTPSNSCSWRLSSLSSIDEKALSSSNEEESLEDASLSFFAQDLYSGLVMEMEQKQRFRQYLEECRPSLTRPRHAEHFQYGIKEQKHKEGSEKKSVPARKKLDAGQMQLSNLNSQAPKKLGKSRSHSQVEYKNNIRALSPKPNGIGYNAKQSRPKGTKSNQRGVKPSDKCRNVSSGINSEKCGDSGGSITVCDSFAVVKSSCDPEADFRESMAEMIKENNIQYHRDLQRLLRCYLSLNPVENHDIIIKAFEQVRSDFTNTSAEY